MIKPLTTVNAVVNGENIALADGDNAPNLGKDALGSLLKGEDIHASEGEANIIPFHAVDYATVTHSSAEAEDPVDDLCKPEEGGGALGLWKFNETISLAPMGTEWNVTWTGGGVNGESIKFDHYSQQGVDADAFQICSSMVGGCLPAYVDGTGWGAGGQPVIEFTGGDDIENPDFVAWLNANATPSTPPTVSGCWRFNDEVSTATSVTIDGEFTSNGQTFTTITVADENLYYGDTVVYNYSEETYKSEWTNAAYKDICFTGETSLDPAFAQWLNDNATKVN